MELNIQELNSQSFAPFGTVIGKPERQQDAEGPGWKWWGENAFLRGDARPYGIGYLSLEPAPLSFDWAERHMRSMELIAPLNGDCLVYVGPPDYPEEPDRIPARDLFQVFHVRCGQSVLLERGVWHGAPLAIDQPVIAIVLLLANTGKEDSQLVRFEEAPVWIRA